MFKQILEDAKLAGFQDDMKTVGFMSCDYEQLTKFAELTKAYSQWIDCSVELPKLPVDGSYRIDTLCLFETYKYKGHQEVVTFCKRTNSEPKFEHNSAEFITHWQPLPLPPNAQQERN